MSGLSLILLLLIMGAMFERLIAMHDLKRVRQYLIDEAAIRVANALASSHLDYCNSLSSNLSSFNIANSSVSRTYLPELI